MAGRRKGMEWWNEATAWGVPAWGLSLPFAWTQFASTSVRGNGRRSGQLLQLIFNLWQMLRTEGRGRAAAYRRKSSKNKIELIETKSALLTKKALVPLAFGERRAQRTLLNSRKFALDLPLFSCSCFFSSSPPSYQHCHFRCPLPFPFAVPMNAIWLSVRQLVG